MDGRKVRYASPMIKVTNSFAVSVNLTARLCKIHFGAWGRGCVGPSKGQGDPEASGSEYLRRFPPSEQEDREILLKATCFLVRLGSESGD
jgi:hypothetical protein